MSLNKKGTIKISYNWGTCFYILEINDPKHQIIKLSKFHLLHLKDWSNHFNFKCQCYQHDINYFLELLKELCFLKLCIIKIYRGQTKTMWRIYLFLIKSKHIFGCFPFYDQNFLKKLYMMSLSFLLGSLVLLTHTLY